MTGFMKTIASEFQPIDDFIHPFEIIRAGQVRGIPFGVAGFIKMADFSDYEDAQLIKQKTAAAFAAFVSNAEGQGIENDTLESIEPGTIEYLNGGETIQFANPPLNGDYSEYSKKILQGIAAAYNITYEMLTTDYSNVNYTSYKAAKIDTIEGFRNLQYNMFVPQVCVPVWDWFMDACIIAGLSNTKLSCNARDWTAPKVQMVDAVKETNANIAMISAGLTTWSEVIRESGREPDEMLEEYKTDMEKLKEHGVFFTSVMLAPVETTNNQTT